MMGGGDSPAAHHRPTQILQTRIHMARLSSSWIPRGVISTSLLWAVGCAPRGGVVPPTPSPRVDPPVVNPLAEPWQVEQKNVKVSQVFRVDAVLVSRIDTKTEVDTVVSQADVTWESTANGRWVGAVDRFVVGRDSVAVPAGISFPVPVTLTRPRREGEVPRFVVPAEGSCAPTAAITQVLREGIIAVPRTLRRDQTWSDSSQATICRDSIPLVVTTVRQHRVVGAEWRDGAVVVLIDRESRVRMRGEGRQLGEPVQLVAEGGGTIRLAVRADDGVLDSADGSTELVMRFTGRRRSQELRQRSRVRILRR